MDREQMRAALTRDRDKVVAAVGDERRWDVADVMAVLERWGVFSMAESADRDARLAAVLADLNRCEHGRHEGDVCGGVTGCNGPSHGNPLLAGEPEVVDLRGEGHVLPPRTIGFDLSQNPIVVPERARMHEPEAWRTVQP